ncbi:hypothetical protein ASPACDRAFT_62830 [Aspergillus aculeatus ATCC 16872]|uniref:DNA-directed RNA polymerase III RPC4 n=1 Tax=Aspergillus aculeatus (strain ATCC 16872 / CBS 172.66 / WB 5094) TaxID=690307 RepID=A0A1L9WLU7_ASPA1|nr:uncharacterized protein ASPACDRAFT_62830 [Aspergillus aculeatus ATCC 16872]OJJ97124.1 hypothetical protein ASPACDRAFT_62830 [Aspergillus aculeatus ATCC 16872]
MPPKAPPRRGGAAAAAAAAGTRRTTAAASASAAEPNNAPTTESTTTTAAAAGPKPPVQRLQTLKKRTPPSGSIARPSPTPAPGPPGSNEPAKPTLKYKPRAVNRRSKEEREAIEKLEAQRNRERLKEAAAIQRGRGGGQHGGGRGGRGGMRGGMMGPGGGPLGPGMGGARRGRGGALGGGFDSRSRSRSVMDLGATQVGEGGDGYVSSDESDGEVRVSIDRINLGSDDDDEVDNKDRKVKLEGRGGIGVGGLRPLRLERHEHEERVVSVNMESSTTGAAEAKKKEAEAEKAEKKKKKKAEDDDALFVAQDDDGGEDVEENVDEEDQIVKEEPTDEEDQVMTDVPRADEGATNVDDGLLPVQKVKVRRKLSPSKSVSESAVPSPEPEVVIDPKSLLRTKEDIEEYERHEQDLEIVKTLFQKEPRPEAPEALAGAAEGAAEGEDKEKEKDKEGDEEEPKEEEEDKLAGQLFLMQFPPLTPNLVLPGTETTDSHPTTTTETPATEQPVKREDEMEIVDGDENATAAQGSAKVVTAADPGLLAGRVGKLNVHASGRVTMDWGGISFELDRATAVDFSQEALIVSTPPNAGDEEFPDDEKKVWAMGQLSGKFTVTPDWQKML